jgi:hypothetical protein
MVYTRTIISPGNSSFLYLLARALFLATVIAGALYSPGFAASVNPPDFSQNPVQLSACTPPSDWNQTVRLKNPQKPTRNWNFNISEPQMEVELEFFYYQDYDKSGCPFDCSTGNCQTDETGKGETPLGNINVLDGKNGGNKGVKKLNGILTQGTYEVFFTAEGNPGSINVGLNVKINALPTATLQPTDTPIPTPTTPTESPPPTEIEPTPPTETEQPPTDVPPPTATTPPPAESPTPTGTKTGPTPTETEVTHTPPATLPPITPFPGSATPMLLIPVTGIDAAAQTQDGGINSWLLITFGVGVFGVGIAFYGIATRLKRE